MRIAQVAPLMESVPPRLYGGIERMVHYLTEELVRQGHDVTLFATGDSRSNAKLVSSVPEGLRLAIPKMDPVLCNLIQLEHVRQRAADFDIIHFHNDFTYFPMTRAGIMANSITTLHGRLDLPSHKVLFDEFKDVALVSISEHQRLPLPSVNWRGTVHYGLPTGVCEFKQAPTGDYLAFLGRLAPVKRPDWAIETARKVGLRLKMAAKVDDPSYFLALKSALGAPHVDFIGEITEREKVEFLGNALALLFPFEWPEAFGLVLIEAMSCGTPVIAWRGGATAEIVDEGVTGFIVDSVEEAVEAVRSVPALDRVSVRKRFEKRFRVERVAKEYLNIYEATLRSARVVEGKVQH
jgi:glycosyltransferase involved in cell wall biosynthesis